MVTSNVPRVSLIIPTLNGSTCLRTLVPRILSTRMGLNIWELLLVDDGSDEENKDVLRILESQYPNVHIITLKKNFGQRLATLVGSISAKGDYIITLDDNNHPPEIIWEILQTLQNNPEIDLVYANPSISSQIRSGSYLRLLGTRLNSWLFTQFLGMPRGIRVGSFRGFTGQLKKQALEKPVSFPYLSAMLLSCKPGVKVVRYTPIPQMEDHQRPSHYRLHTLAKLWLTLFYFWGPLSFLARIFNRKFLLNPQDYIQIEKHKGTEVES